ncbi:MAG: sensor histidine kinase [Planctomycetota bacterium]|jgi:PAS domain S-box-containing protein
MSSLSPALRIALIYAFFGVLWIALSDSILNALISDKDTMAAIQTYKGWFFIAITAALVYFMVRDYTRRQSLAEREIKRSQRRYRDIVEDQTEMICRQDVDGCLTFVNPAFCRGFGEAPEDLLGRRFEDLIPQEDRGHLEQLLESLGEAEPVDEIEHRIPGPSGDSYHHWTHRVILDDRGAPIEYQSTGRDVTEERQASKRQAALVYELDHRVKNNLAVVSSKTMEDFAVTLNGRIRAISLAHETLARKRWKGVGLEGLISEMLRAYADDRDGRVSLHGPEVMVPAVATQPLGLAINELATNAVKHGALSTPGGSVEVNWSCDGERVTLNWVEKGGPVIEPPVKTGTGLSIVRGLVEYELNGNLDLEFFPTGLRGSILFPVHLRD